MTPEILASIPVPASIWRIVKNFNVEWENFRANFMCGIHASQRTESAARGGIPRHTEIDAFNDGMLNRPAL